MNITQRPPYQKGQKATKRPSGKDPAHLAKVAALPCIICDLYGLPQNSPTQVHHCICGRFSTRKVPDRQTVPLCDGHHIGDFDTSKVAIHRDRTEWVRLYGPDTDYIAATLDRIGA